MTETIITDRLELIPATAATVRAALESNDALAELLGVVVPESWPPEFLDAPALAYTIARLEEGDAQAGWWLHFIVLARGAPPRTLIGSAGYKGPPSPDGAVEVGYGIVRDHQRRGYATESTLALVARAFALPEMRRVIAETLPELVGSIGVLRKCGFRFVGEGSEPGVIRFELGRADWEGREHDVTFDEGTTSGERQ